MRNVKIINTVSFKNRKMLPHRNMKFYSDSVFVICHSSVIKFQSSGRHCILSLRGGNTKLFFVFAHTAKQTSDSEYLGLYHTYYTTLIRSSLIWF